MLGLTEFIGELTLTETRQVQSTLTATGLRLFAVCVLGLFVVTSMVREINDKGFEMLLSLSLSRGSYYFGKLLGFALLSWIIVIASGLILAIYSPLAEVLIWCCSLACEALIIIALSLLCLFTFNSITTAFVAVIAFYLLSRSMYVIQLISDSPLLETGTFSQAFINFMLDAIAYLLPDLNLFTRSAWLIHGSDIHDITLVLAQTAIYVMLLVAAGLFDLYRKEF
jgi:ABC-type Na+ efflux pump permease subunit